MVCPWTLRAGISANRQMHVVTARPLLTCPLLLSRVVVIVKSQRLELSPLQFAVGLALGEAEFLCRLFQGRLFLESFRAH